jgi:hypothetical protein
MEFVKSVQREKCFEYIKKMIQMKQWSGIPSYSHFKEWFDFNFDGIDEENLYLVYKLLINIIYFSESDLVDLLRDAINNKLTNKYILAEQIKSNFSYSRQTLMNLQNNYLSSVIYLSKDYNISSSGSNYLSRLLVKNKIVKEKQLLNLYDLYPQKNKQVVIIDDCLGSGNQFDTFLSNKKIFKTGESIISWSAKNNIKVTVLILFGYSESVRKLKYKYPNIDFLCVRSLNIEHRVFSDNSYIWFDVNETKDALAFFLELTDKKGMKLLGYKDLDFLLIMHDTVPNWTLPLIWDGNGELWKPLIGRKNTDE